MKWLRAAIVLALLGPACSLLAGDDGYFEGDSGTGGASTSGGSDAGGAAPDPGSGGAGAMSGAAGSGAMSGAGGGAAGESSGGVGGSSGGGAGGSSGEAGASSGAAGESGAGASGANGCSRPDACPAGMTETTMQACGACGTGKQSHGRTCAPDTCTWGPWSDWTACAGVTAACTPGDTSPCANGDSCGQRVCSSSCTWGGCAPKAGAACLRIGEGHSNEGSNYRCCGTGKWEFCLPSCQWSGDCVSCSEGAPNYCSDCYP